MLDELNITFAGLSYPFAYGGLEGTSFPVHLEDLHAWSYNIQVYGKEKVWGTILSKDYLPFLEYVCLSFQYTISSELHHLYIPSLPQCYGDVVLYGLQEMPWLPQAQRAPD
jgi:hypothetical protein